VWGWVGVEWVEGKDRRGSVLCFFVEQWVRTVQWRGGLSLDADRRERVQYLA
jgi:hypothetical protein